MSAYSRRFNEGDDSRIINSRRGRAIERAPAENIERKTKWSGRASSKVTFGKESMDTIIRGHLTYEQIDAYQQIFRIEEISEVLRTAQEKEVEVLSLLPSEDPANRNYMREPSPPPIYDRSGNRTNTREARVVEEMEKERHFLVELAVRNIKGYTSPVDYRKPVKTNEKLYIPIKEHPEINFVGLLLGPRGNTLRQLQEESGAKLAIRGKGSVKDGRSMSMIDKDGSSSHGKQNEAEEDLHVVITADSHQKIAKAIKLTNEVIEKAISSPVGQNDLKRDQLRELAILNGTLRETKPYNPEATTRRSRPGIDVSQVVCKICGKIGHFARDCKSRFTGQTDNVQKNHDDPQNLAYVGEAGPSKRENENANNGDESIPPWKKQKVEQTVPPWKRDKATIVPPQLPSLNFSGTHAQNNKLENVQGSETNQLRNVPPVISSAVPGPPTIKPPAPPRDGVVPRPPKVKPPAPPSDINILKHANPKPPAPPVMEGNSKATMSKPPAPPSMDMKEPRNSTVRPPLPPSPPVESATNGKK